MNNKFKEPAQLLMCLRPLHCAGAGAIARLLVSILLLSAEWTQAEQGVEAWVRRYSSPPDSFDRANKVATDSAGNVIVAGYTPGSVRGSDMLIIKYSNAGVALWTNRYNGPGIGFDSAEAVAVDGDGNVFVTGPSSASGSGSSSDYATIKYSSAGMGLWTNRYPVALSGQEYLSAVATDGNGNVFVTGSPDTNGLNSSVTIKYSNAGLPLWTNRYQGPANGNDSPCGHCLAIGPEGSAYVTGNSDADYTAGSRPEFAIVKYVSVPDLSIALTSTNTARVSWSLTPTGFDLQQNTSLDTANWVVPPETIRSNSTSKFIIADSPTSTRFFRLVRP